AYVGEEDLVALGRPGQPTQGTDLDAGGRHVEDEVGQAFVLLNLGVGAGQEEPEPGELGDRGPDLLPVHDPPAAVPRRPGGKRSQVGTGARLAEELAPPLLAAEDLAQVALLLGVGAVGDDRGPSQADAQDVGAEQGKPVAAQLLP